MLPHLVKELSRETRRLPALPRHFFKNTRPKPEPAVSRRCQIISMPKVTFIVTPPLAGRSIRSVGIFLEHSASHDHQLNPRKSDFTFMTHDAHRSTRNLRR